MFLCSNSRHNIHPVHQSSSHQVVECIGVVGQNQFGHADEGFAWVFLFLDIKFEVSGFKFQVGRSEEVA